MAQANDNNSNEQPIPCQPGGIVDCGGWSWQCHCPDGSPADWLHDPKGKMVECMGCDDKIYGNVKCYGFQDVYENDEDAWEK